MLMDAISVLAFWISVLSWSLESAVLILSAWFLLPGSQVGQPCASFCLDCCRQAWEEIDPRCSKFTPGRSQVAAVSLKMREGREAWRFCVCFLYFHLGSISTTGPRRGAPPTTEAQICPSQPASPVWTQKPACC